MVSEEDLKITHVYKFMRISDEKCIKCGKFKTNYFERFRNLVEKKQLFFANPSSFNDPFDCLVDFEKNIKEKDFKNYIKRLKVDRLPEGAQTIAEGIAIMDNIFEKQRKTYADETIGVCCFSSIWDNILLWSHYADSHNGVCIGFKVSFAHQSVCIKTKDYPVFNEPVEPGTMPLVHVTYSETMPKAYNPYLENTMALETFLRTKNKKWEYENEMRALLSNPENFNRKIELFDDTIDEITLGINMNKEQKYKVISLIQPLNRKISIYEACFKKHSYDVDRKLIL